MDDLLADFIEETREMLEAIGSEIVAWEANPADRARLDAIFRFVHTVKGNCGFFDFPRLEKLSHAAEDALADVRKGRREADSQLVTAVLAIVDRISDMITAIEAGQELAEGSDEALIAALEAGAETAPMVGQSPAPARPADSVTTSTAAPSSAPRSIRLPVELLDRVMSGVSDMVLARNDLAHRLKEAGNQPTVDGPFERLSSILTNVRDAITRMRMQRIETLYTAIPRLVRDLSADLGKQVMVDLEGGEVELDREMIEMMRDPLTHIIRNAIDHGFEPPAERLKNGKREIGLLSIAARQAGNKISIVISDDGRGLDEERIAAKAVSTDIIAKAQRSKMSREEILDLIFAAGFSTAEEVSSVSGRGVGMDVVRDNLEKVGGEIQVSSQPGEGTRFYLQIPLTLSIIAGLTLKAGGQRFVLPQSYVEEIVRLRGDKGVIEDMGDTSLVTFREQRVHMISLADVLGVKAEVPRENANLLMLRLASGDLYALAVDQVQSSSDIVVKPLPPTIMSCGIYCGTTLLDDGQPILLLDVPNIAQEYGLMSETRALSAQVLIDGKPTVERPLDRAMLFSKLDGHKRLVRLELVKRIETISAAAIDRSGRESRAVVDGEILPVIGIDENVSFGDSVRLLRLTDGSSEVLHAVGSVEDAVDLADELVAVDESDPLIEAVTLIEGESIALIDSHKLFAIHGAVPRQVASKTCQIPDSDWAKTILAPLIESAGYALAFDADADIVITLDAVESLPTAKPVIALRSAPDDQVEPSQRNSSIYRYDRERLISALRDASKGEAA
uniref:chemotaxis protein CheA n=1 Tax=uncultured Altererythrobacter sp. TaxID=500840 RepID=UPI0026148198|nr:chemotaxis protein CheA [uncultured Altererythrobacter sp.]